MTTAGQVLLTDCVVTGEIRRSSSSSKSSLRWNVSWQEDNQCTIYKEMHCPATLIFRQSNSSLSWP